MDPGHSRSPATDRLSDLDVSILVTILSFLPFKDAVRTSVLSRQWRGLWRFTQNVEFDERFFVKDDDTPEDREAHRLQFIGFVRGWMDNFPGRAIDSFALTLSRPLEFASDVNRSISFALTKGVKGFGLDFSEPAWNRNDDDEEFHNPVFDLPSRVYEHEGFSSLRLHSVQFGLFNFINIRALKEVSLGFMKLSMSAISTLVTNCPLLESLSLKRCWNIDLLDIKGQNLKLTSLVIDGCHFIQDWYSVVAPNLKFLKFSGLVGVFEFEFGKSLEEAVLDFGMHDSFDEFGELLYRLLWSLDSVRVLTVCSYMLQVIPTAEEALSMEFPMNVRHLIMKTSVQNRDLWGISFFLKSCPYLEILTLEITPRRVLANYESPYSGSHQFHVPNSSQYQCIIFTLKVVEVKMFKGSKQELEMLKYLAKYGRVMRELKLYVSSEGDDQIRAQRGQAVENLMSAPKASGRLQIVAQY